MKKSHQQRHRKIARKSAYHRWLNMVHKLLFLDDKELYSGVPQKPKWKMPYLHGGDLWQQTCAFKETPAARIGVGNAEWRLREKRKLNAKIYG